MFFPLSPLEKIQLLGASLALSSGLAAHTIGGSILSLVGAMMPAFYLGVVNAAIASRRSP